MDCSFGSSKSSCNITFAEGIIFQGIPNFQGSSKYNGIVKFPQTVGQNSSTPYLQNNLYLAHFFRDDDSYNCNFNVPNYVSSCYEMFSSLPNYNAYVRIGENVSDMTNMFANCEAFNKSVNFGSGGNTNINCYCMFKDCAKYNKPVTIEQTRNIISNNGQQQDIEFQFSCMFENCSKMNSDVDIFINTHFGNGITPKLIMWNMFNQAINFNANVNLSFESIVDSESALSVIFMPNMFNGCNKFNQPFEFNKIFNFSDSYKEIVCNNMFKGCDKFNQPIYIPEVEFSGHESFGYYFFQALRDCKEFNSIITFDLEGIEHIVDIGCICYNCQNYNQPVTIPNGKFEASKAFANCTSFNSTVVIGDIGSCDSMFDNCRQLDKPISIGNVYSCSNMFRYCTSLNSPVVIGDSAGTLFHMFSHCTNFNYPVTIPPNTQSCVFMFEDCTNFNQDVFVPDSVQNWGQILIGCENFKSTLSLPYKGINSGIGIRYGGLSPSENTLGATVIWRSEGESDRVILYNFGYMTSYVWESSVANL